MPIAVQAKLKIKLQELVRNGIIEKSVGLNEWVHHMVIAEKKDEQKSIRICLDPYDLNACIVDDQHYIPTFDDVTSKLHGMKYFSVLDLKDGFWHVKLAEESRKYCTFGTPFGNFRYMRMPFGIKTGPKIFQKMNFENFGDIDGVIIYFDDLLIVGRTREDHDSVLKKVLDRAREKNVRFNPNKVQIGLEEVKYFGHIFSLNSVKPDPERIEAIKNISRPKNKKDLHTFLGVINYVQMFIPNVSEKTAPLRELIKKNVIFQWTELHTRTFEEIKECIINANVLVPFDITIRITIRLGLLSLAGRQTDIFRIA